MESFHDRGIPFLRVSRLKLGSLPGGSSIKEERDYADYGRDALERYPSVY